MKKRKQVSKITVKQLRWALTSLSDAKKILESLESLKIDAGWALQIGRTIAYVKLCHEYLILTLNRKGGVKA